MNQVNWDLLGKYLAGECNADEKEKVQAWLTASEANRKYLEEVQQLWEASGSESIPPEPSLEAAWRKVDQATSRPARVLVYKPYLRIAASFLLVTLIGLLVYLSAFYQKQITTITGENEKKEILLADGSRIWLNENSSLVYPQSFTGDLREVKLQGEAFFEIARNEAQPFQIKAGSSITRVLGTSFNIRQEADTTVEIGVITGKVSFYAADWEANSIILQAGENGLLTASAPKLIKTKSADANFLAWHTGTLSFRNVALQEVIPRLEQLYHKKLILENKALATCLLTTRFEKRSLEEVLQILQTIYSFRYEINGDTIYLQAGEC
jgi:ferric-dicitrate binding protein FerR (iron transport regulator)